MFIIGLVANLRELYLRNYRCVYVRTDLYMKLHTELGRLCINFEFEAKPFQANFASSFIFF